MGYNVDDDEAIAQQVAARNSEGDTIPRVQVGDTFYQAVGVLKGEPVYREVKDVGEFSPAWKAVDKADLVFLSRADDIKNGVGVKARRLSDQQTTNTLTFDSLEAEKPVASTKPAVGNRNRVDPDNMTTQALGMVGDNKPLDGVDDYLPTDSRDAPNNSKTKKSRYRGKEHPRNRINRNR